MVKARLVFACWCLVFTLPLQAFEWGTATSKGRDYVTLQSFCTFYKFPYQDPMGNDYFRTRNAEHSIGLKVGSSDLYIDGVHYVMSFPIESDGHDWLVSRMDVIKLFDPVLRGYAVAHRHRIRGVVIDPGHGGADNGAVSARGGAEKNYTLDTAFRLEKILRAAGLKVVLTRRTDVFINLYERAYIASLYPDYAFVSIHYNSATPEARGLETYCLSPRGAASTSASYLTRSDIQKLPGNDYDAENILLASMVQSEIIRLNPGDPTADRGVKRARFVVIKQNVLPAILVEGGFVSNRMEAARVNRPDYRQRLAELIAAGIIRFADVMGNQHMSLPEAVPDENSGAPPPRAIAVTPLAPSGMAHESHFRHSTEEGEGSVRSEPKETISLGATGTHRSKEPRKKTASSRKSSKSESAGVTSTKPDRTRLGDDREETKATSQTASGPLNLGEPVMPTPAAGKANDEPDEPPTVNIYPTTDASSPGPSSGGGKEGGGSGKSSTKDVPSSDEPSVEP